MALLFAGHDENGPQLFHLDPSGTFLQHDAKAIGSASEGAQQALQEVYHKVSYIRLFYVTKRSLFVHLFKNLFVAAVLAFYKHTYWAKLQFFDTAFSR